MLGGTDLTIKRVKSLNGMGVFRGYTAANDETDLKKLNLIYGFNGSGKTTLSRIFACLERGKLSGMLPEGGKFEIELEDGTAISHESNLDALKAKVAVFNSDFVDENFQWKDGSARPVFYIGKEQADKGRELRKNELLLEPAREKKTTTANAHQKIARAFAASKTETARNIGEQTNHRAFNARHLDGEFAKGDRGSDALIDDDRRKELRAIILQDAPLPKVEVLGLPGAAATEFPQLVRQTRACLTQTVAASTLSDLAAHPDMLGWVKAGHDYHVGHALADCLFCGNPVSRERLAAIEAAIDDRFDRIVAETSRLSAEAAVLRERLTLAATAVPSKNDIVGDPRAFEVAAQRYRDGLEGMLTALTPWKDALRRKSATPNARIEAAAGVDDEQAETLQSAIDAARSAVNDAIMAHNTAHDEFANRQSAAKRALLEHYLAEACATYRDLEKQVAEAEGAATSAATDFDELDAKVEKLREELRNHGSAATAINGLIKAYLRHGDIEIVADDEGFQLRRQGGQIAKHLPASPARFADERRGKAPAPPSARRAGAQPASRILPLARLSASFAKSMRRDGCNPSWRDGGRTVGRNFRREAEDLSQDVRPTKRDRAEALAHAASTGRGTARQASRRPRIPFGAAGGRPRVRRPSPPLPGLQALHRSHPQSIQKPSRRHAATHAHGRVTVSFKTAPTPIASSSLR